ncbi:MAG: RpoL/Rpb11 RNA polymerase subunit family protein [Candidatus Nitrosoabyssus spongiisocia]|nr:MAG: RpoL/Rpb11 RNA polymerase subunit family protein [Nitrosopumilaceae archaeon AB1(1)]
MEIQVLESSPKQVQLSVIESDIGLLYIIQHELLSRKDIDFAGVIVKHPLTNECWVKVDSTKDPLPKLMSSVDDSLKVIDNLISVFQSSIKKE